MYDSSEIMELAAIWLEKPINGKIRIQEGDYIAISNGRIISAEHASHKIIGCFGNVFSSILMILTIDVITNEPNFYTLKD